jgi:formylglycine-generating enzyme required for sulfatase activity
MGESCIWMREIGIRTREPGIRMGESYIRTHEPGIRMGKLGIWMGELLDAARRSASQGFGLGVTCGLDTGGGSGADWGVAARDVPAARRFWPPVRPAWLSRIERAMRPLDHLPRGAMFGAGAALGAGAGIALGWSGEPWTLAAGAVVLGGAGWLVASAEPVAVAERVGKVAKSSRAQRPPSGESAHPVEPLTRPASKAPEMVDLPGGQFWMGSAADEARVHPDQCPRHEVAVAAFSIGRYAVTDKLYRAVMGGDPETIWDDFPAVNVSWYDAIAFCNLLSDREGLTRAYVVKGKSVTWQADATGYRLPTEAEREYACRAGTQTAYSFGDDAAELGAHAWSWGNSGGQAHQVGTRRPNPWGLHDMHGNVHEWCWDVYAPYPYEGPSPRVSSGSSRVLRGASWKTVLKHCRSAHRGSMSPGKRHASVGFRCARGPLRGA